MVVDQFPTPYDPQCAQKDCRERPRFAVKVDDLTLAYACVLPHLTDVMRMTRHIGVRRIIVGLGP